MKEIRCPKCGGVDVYLREHIICYEKFGLCLCRLQEVYKDIGFKNRPRSGGKGK